ncbi:MAG: hypothetical protein IPN11_16695 [Opitutaceae bacterium]|nr:hypothetical protein [Opitutaceae bacterium]
MNEEDPPPRKFTFKDNSFQRENVAATPPAPSVHEILRDNLAVQKSLEPAVLPNLKDRRTKRCRDYWLLMLTMNSLIALVGWKVYGNPAGSVILLSFCVIFNVGLPWIMFQVMDKY